MTLRIAWRWPGWKLNVRDWIASSPNHQRSSSAVTGVTSSRMSAMPCSRPTQNCSVRWVRAAARANGLAGSRMGQAHTLARRKHIVYCSGKDVDWAYRSSRVIRSFADKETERLFATERSRRLPPDILFRCLGADQRAPCRYLHRGSEVSALESIGAIERGSHRSMEYPHQSAMATLLPVHRRRRLRCRNHRLPLRYRKHEHSCYQERFAADPPRVLPV